MSRISTIADCRCIADRRYLQSLYIFRCIRMVLIDFVGLWCTNSFSYASLALRGSSAALDPARARVGLKGGVRLAGPTKKLSRVTRLGGVRERGRFWKGSSGASCEGELSVSWVLQVEVRQCSWVLSVGALMVKFGVMTL